MTRAHCLVGLACLTFPLTLWAQESQLGAELRHEDNDFHEDCVQPSSLFGGISGCGQLLFTDHPLHIAVGSLAPQNGFGAGLAFTTHYTPNEDWRLSWDVDAVATSNGSWRAGAYMTAVFTRQRSVHVVSGATPAAHRLHLAVEDMPAFHVYAQAESLNKLTYFGLGQETSQTDRSYFGMQQTIAGANVVWPVWKALNLSLFGEANGRFVSLRGNHTQTNPSIEQAYTDVTAPGLAHQPGFAQFGEGVRLRPTFAKGYIRLNYTATFEEWLAAGSGYSFRRLSTDLSHQFPLYRTSRPVLAREFNGPDSCLPDANAEKCPGISRNLEGNFGLQFLYTASFTSAGSRVPFYFDPTLGGSDINGTTILPSYTDYRFRAPNLMLLRGSFEHSIYKWPLGAKFLIDEGRVGLTRGQIGFDHLAHSYATGLTIHAGGLPVIDLLFAWGGHEGTHTIANVSTSLLGGSARPSLN